MPVIFASPAATGKTTFKEALKHHFGCSCVYDDGAMSYSSSRPIHKQALILCQPTDLGSHNPHLKGKLLSRAEMNAAMVAVGGKAIWDESGKVLHA